MTEPLAEVLSQTELEPAGFWLRGGALVVDNLLLSAFTLGLSGILAWIGLPSWLLAVLNIGIPAVYFTWMPAARAGQTIGKKLAGLAIVGRHGEELTYGKTFLRWIGYMLSALTIGIGYLLALFTDQKRALQDMTAGTRVVVVNPISGLRRFILVSCAVLMPLLAAVGVAVSLGASKFGGMSALADEAMAKAELSQVRSAVALYAKDNGGAAPKDLTLVAPKYLPIVPEIEVGGHAKTLAVTVYGPEACSGSKDEGQQLNAAALKDTGGWGYVVAPGAPCDGAVFVDAAQKDSSGREWFRN